ncbi:MAG: DUF3794 domain-containing protein [Oscillospiraceae bacterium]|nr:DUF3794 domain-containing protein [Oscillospiraceae bacterium]
MELGLEKRRTGRYTEQFSGGAVYEENTEMIVPDNSPDVLRIIKGCANVFLKDKSSRDGKTDISGMVKGAVLYVAEGERGLRKLDISMPFAYVLDTPGVTPDSKLVVVAKLRSIDVREINPRKISVRAGIDVAVRAYGEVELELCADVNDADKYGVCVRKTVVSTYSPINLREKSFIVSDDIELSSKECDMAQILVCDAALVPGDTKIIGNKAIVKGNAGITYIYALEDGEIACGEYELPFSQIIDIDGMDESNDLRIALNVTGIELDPQYDASGKARYMTASIAATAVAEVFELTDIESVNDVYSTKYELSVASRDVSCKRLCDRKEKRVAVNETVETGMGIKQVLDASVNLMPCTRRREEGGEVLGCDAAISVTYIGEDDGVYSATRRTAAICPLPLNSNLCYDVRSEVRGKSFSVGAGNEINVRFFTDFDITETEEIAVPAILSIEADPERERRDRDTPSVIVKRLDSDCDIWSLAKEYATTVEEIKLANDITEDITLSCGRMVLIPRKR